MFVEIDQIAVPVDTIARIRGGDNDTKIKLRQELAGITLYMHALSLDPQTQYEIITLREAEELGIVDAVVIARAATGVNQMSKDFYIDAKLSSGRQVVVLYHYERVENGSVPVIDGIWDEDMEEDVPTDEIERTRIVGMITATFMERDLS